MTDGYRCATFRDHHPETPRHVCLYGGGERCVTYPVVNGASIVIEA